jgi:hypothetical protein
VLFIREIDLQKSVNILEIKSVNILAILQIAGSRTGTFQIIMLLGGTWSTKLAKILAKETAKTGPILRQSCKMDKVCAENVLVYRSKVSE